jgi:hypothetical protein
LLTLLLLLSLFAASCAGATRAPKTLPATPERPGFRFQRADLIDVAGFVAERTESAFVLAQPEWRGLSLSLYSAVDVEAAVLVAMFETALQGVGLRLIEQEGFWLIDQTPQTTQPSGLRLSGELIIIDGDALSVAELCGLLSERLSKTYVLPGTWPSRTLSLKALSGISPAALHALLLESARAQGCEVVEREQEVVFGRCGGTL